jgi:glycosyltransferase involved in cell wall biosynthesis
LTHLSKVLGARPEKSSLPPMTSAKPPIRILFPFAGDTGLGGSHVSALGLIGALDRSRYLPIIVMHGAPGAVGAHVQEMGQEYEILPDISLLATPNQRRAGDVSLGRFVTRSLPALRQQIRRLRPDIIHTNEGRMHGNWAVAAQLTRSRHLWHHRQDPRAFGINKLAPLLSDQIVSVSHFAKPVRPIRSVEGRITVVRSPFDFPASRPDRADAGARIRQELGLPAQAVVLGWFGMLVGRKRPVQFVEAVDAIQRALPDRPVHGVMLGGPDAAEPDLETRTRARAADLGIADRIHLMGFRTPVAPWMAGVDISLVTALHEPFGRTLIEAMDLGTPVVATRHGGNVEALRDGETGHLVDPEAPAAFVPPVLRLLNDAPHRRRVIDAAQIEVRRSYGRDIHLRQICAVYDRMMARGRHGSGPGSDS